MKRAWILLLVVIAAFAAIFAYPLYGRRNGSVSNERSSSTTLKTLASAQADFRANDRDGDGVNQFWRGNIAGLYTLAPKGGPAIKLIELGVAAADATKPKEILPYSGNLPKEGYWYKALRHADEKTTLDGDRFAAEAYPATYGPANRWTYVLDENNRIFRADLGHGRGVEVFPADEELKKSWTKLD